MAQESQYFQSTFVLSAYKETLSVYPFLLRVSTGRGKKLAFIFYTLQRAKMKKRRELISDFGSFSLGCFIRNSK